MKVLLLNAGSSSLKGTLMESLGGRVLAAGMGEWAGERAEYRMRIGEGEERRESVSWRGAGAAVRRMVADLTEGETPVLSRKELGGVGHRVVHGGEFTESVRITPAVRERIAALVELAPLHNPPSLEGIDAALEELPEVAHVAVFDTAFHATLPEEARTYPVPEKWRSEWGIRRYGFHGLSHAYCAGRAAEMLGRRLEELRMVICHLGHGCSACAVQGGKSVDTTMGFTPLEGLMMGTRSGSVDPGIVFHLQKQCGLTVEEVERGLNRESGLLGVSGFSGDMREVLAAAHCGDARAKLALGIYAYRVRQAVGAFAVTMGGIDCLVFTAGVGEHAAEVREMICRGLECLGLELDAGLNFSVRGDTDVTMAGSRGRVFVVSTREDVVMLREVVAELRSARE